MAGNEYEMDLDVEVEFVGDEKFKLLEEAIENALREAG